jgi:hypothetical protein
MIASQIRKAFCMTAASNGKPQPVKRVCGNCRFFWAAADIVQEGPFKGAARGECLVNPPQLMLIPAGGRPSFSPQGMGQQQAMQAVGMSPSCLSARPACKQHELTDEAVDNWCVETDHKPASVKWLK